MNSALTVFEVFFVCNSPTVTRNSCTPGGAYRLSGLSAAVQLKNTLPSISTKTIVSPGKCEKSIFNRVFRLGSSVCGSKGTGVFERADVVGSAGTALVEID